jgi:hypothetical protein
MFKIQEVKDEETVFGAQDIGKMMPAYGDIPEEFKNFNSSNKWLSLVKDMFFSGLKSLELTPKDGVDVTLAKRHIRSIMVSYRPKHEHKIAGCAFLFNEWFSDVKWA